MTYTSLEQRMAQNYIDTFPSFVSDETAPVNVSEQELFYLLIEQFLVDHLIEDNDPHSELRMVADSYWSK